MALVVVGLIGSAIAKHAGGLAINSEEDRSSPVAAQVFLPARSRAGVVGAQVSLQKYLQHCQLAKALPSTLPVTPLPAWRIKIAGDAELQLLLPAPQQPSPPPADARCHAPGEAARRSTSSSLMPWTAAATAVTAGFAHCQRAGFVDHQRIDFFEPLQSLGILDQHARLRAAPDADHDRHRRGQAKGAGAGDDENAETAAIKPTSHARFGAKRRPGRESRYRHATKITNGTNQPATWSASRWIGARLRWALATIWTICASMVSRPTFCGAHDKGCRSWLIVPPISFEPPMFLATGMDFARHHGFIHRAASLLISSPSTGTFSPGRTRKPVAHRQMLHWHILVSLPSGLPAGGRFWGPNQAGRGWLRRSARGRAIRGFGPSRTSTVITAAASKYTATASHHASGTLQRKDVRGTSVATML